jgi:hypothetical protein
MFCIDNEFEVLALPPALACTKYCTNIKINKYIYIYINNKKNKKPQIN